MTAERRTIWTFAHADMLVYWENPSTGELIDYVTLGDVTPEVEPDPVMVFCFAENVSISAMIPTVRRAITGRGRRKIVCKTKKFDEIYADIGHLFFRKLTEFNLTDVFNPDKQLRFVFNLADVGYTGEYPLENDQIILSVAKATQFKLTGEGDQAMAANVHIDAELIL